MISQRIFVRVMSFLILQGWRDVGLLQQKKKREVAELTISILFRR